MGSTREEATMADTSAIEKFLHAIETADIPGCDAWSTDATLDATVPNWRLHAAGADAIRAEYAKWFAHPARFDELRRYTAEGGDAEIVEYTLSWTENGAPHAGHHLHVLTVRIADGAEFDARPGDVTALPQGHDAWVVGDEPVVVVDWFGASNYART
jgi:hypothetical protein